MTIRPLRILQVLRAPIGGLFRHVIDLTEALAARGHQVGVVVDSLSADAQTGLKLARLAPAASLGIHALPIPRLLGLADIATPIRVRALARQLQIDVVHGHGAKGGLVGRAARIGIGRKRAVIYTPHGGVLHFAAASPTGRIFHALERAMLRQTDAIIFESAFARAQYEAAIAQPRCPAPIIHNGLAATEFEPVALEENPSDFVFVGELRMLKGITVLMEAMVGLLGADGTPARLVMAGDGPDREALNQQIASLGLGDRVVLVGVQPARAMFAKGRIVVVPSLAESLPYIVLEAAAAGRPVVATDVGGIPEIFGPTAASLVQAGDAAALRSAMRRAIADTAPAQAEAEARHAFVLEHFTISAMTAAIERVYEEAMTKG